MEDNAISLFAIWLATCDEAGVDGNVLPAGLFTTVPVVEEPDSAVPDTEDPVAKWPAATLLAATAPAVFAADERFGSAFGRGTSFESSVTLGVSYCHV
ncbi:hypothetical protein GCM10007086_38290 [Photobacterium aphoticum]|nr:hypothetical protein GCM10007086_38290 [Photobacterium aphoticum]